MNFCKLKKTTLAISLFRKRLAYSVFLFVFFRGGVYKIYTLTIGTFMKRTHFILRILTLINICMSMQQSAFAEKKQRPQERRKHHSSSSKHHKKKTCCECVLNHVKEIEHDLHNSCRPI